MLPECLRIIFLFLVEESPRNISPSNYEVPDNTCNNEIKRNKKTYANIPYIITKDLRSCTLVSRHWYEISTPILYAYPFHNFHNIRYCNTRYNQKEHDEAFKPYYKLIRTLMSCIPEEILKQHLPTYKFNNELKYDFCKRANPTCNYFSLIRGLYFTEELFNLSSWDHYKDDWLPSYFPKHVSGLGLPLNALIEESFVLLVMKEFVKFFCENCHDSSSILELHELLQRDIYYTAIESLPPKKLSGLKELYGEDILQYVIECPTRPRSGIIYLYKNLLPITNLTLFGNKAINSKRQANYLSHFISSQNKLQHIILSEGELSMLNNQRKVISERYYNIVLPSLAVHKEWLVKLEFRNIHFGEVLDQGTVNSLASIENIKELKLIKCNILEGDLIQWARSINKLEIFEFEALDYPTLYIPEKFLEILFQNSSQTLVKLLLNYKRNYNQDSNILRKISQYLHNLTYLYLPTLSSRELLPVFVKCQKLIYISFGLTYNTYNLKELGEYVPKFLQFIQFRDFRDMNDILPNDALKFFLQKSVENGRLKYLEIKGNGNLPQEYFRFTKEIGIQLIYEA
ncbi:hypothetical protein RhiirA5_410413 [Rhizophagus irregularis]|uniref:F-box domain-containing protein n=3 Tax=Rhizophagus irregularis TaxID=588596 RepID=U9TI44_RHIID|nr:hypothetical protein GLOIN_2v1821803 [Rhizophagus irregularis DAOM 181602=DAOM 197198]EXX72929.1 hypothetical protein RirG_064740 [Rhizophagus irregularis DAOM 197198w]PKC13592.1 hypothetical protein RhiirA5_410413 [Rhizophagus irregularis]POG76043.1 hypothetical protein GLOIN_2v1821803 [Rhizophagus irregularis DAOM 181602=DAOM 197198]UZO11481.1 hypothetical protein OCT59_003049 [Rhizophagus irregularis]CAB5217520.1 unnamed protein product [Rhizophagus irregularis]|eukprot:XP_025182909.1 hypothetical protein GLOIN_2v1821803 [Rhizophagus irregularis DAOM 181602=DAOM 197198]